MTSEQDLRDNARAAETAASRAKKRLKVALALAAVHPDSAAATNEKLVELRTQYDDARRLANYAELAIEGYKIMTAPAAKADADLSDLLGA